MSYFFKLSLLVSLLFSVGAQANSVRLASSFSSANGLWVGENSVDFEDADGKGKRKMQEYELSTWIKHSKSEQLYFALTYANTRMDNSDFLAAGTTEDDGRRGISAIEARYENNSLKNAFQFIDITFGAGFRTPGNNSTGDDFLAINDGLIKYDLHLNFHKKISSLFVGLNTTYTLRPEAVNQSLINLTIGHFIGRSFYVEAGYADFKTYGGTDIMGAGFVIDGRPGFSRVREEYNLASLSLVYMRKDYSFDLSYLRKLEGRNTDQTRALILGVSRSY